MHQTEPQTQISENSNSQQNSNEECKELGSFLPDPKDCHKYYVCVGGSAKQSMNCGPGTAWDQSNTVCDHEYRVMSCKNWILSVHLICMPPNGDINCKKSSQYHFVNEYLYKPLNLDEAESKPNVTLRYSERYFPSDIYTDERESGEYRSSSPVRRPVYVAQHAIPTINSIPSGGRPQPSASTPQYRLPVNQVFRSPEEVNIPLQQRRPQIQPPQALRRFPGVRPEEEDY
ncbi:uncharacterized protein LOC111642907 [Copidosoma floridanum]|uniref:uncharacterized protein LOC111642907 n=1 Tax=Copidosoma floridanum TaxID=29053 RepID=UPI000C6F5AB2|nr:uncharacterized protein LOC111642907 [Copidosoma floridanum]